MAPILGVQALEFLDHPLGRRQHNAQCRLALQQFAHLVDLAHVGRRERAHGHALVLLAHDDAGALELVQGLADVVARGAEARDQVVFNEPRAGREAAEDDVFPEHLGDVDGLDFGGRHVAATSVHGQWLHRLGFRA